MTPIQAALDLTPDEQRALRKVVNGEAIDNLPEKLFRRGLVKMAYTSAIHAPDHLTLYWASTASGRRAVALIYEGKL